MLAFLKGGRQGNLCSGINSSTSTSATWFRALRTDLLPSTGTIVPQPSPAFAITGDSVTERPYDDAGSVRYPEFEATRRRARAPVEGLTR